MFAVALFFFGQKLQQYLVPNLVTRRIVLDNGYQLTVPRDVFALDVALHCDLQGSSAEPYIMTEREPFACSILLTARFLAEASVLMDKLSL